MECIKTDSHKKRKRTQNNKIKLDASTEIHNTNLISNYYTLFYALHHFMSLKNKNKISWIIRDSYMERDWNEKGGNFMIRDIKLSAFKN